MDDKDAQAAYIAALEAEIADLKASLANVAPGNTLAIFDQLAEGIIIADAEGVIRYVNDAAARIHGTDKLGVPPDEYVTAFHLRTLDGQPYPMDDLPLVKAVRDGMSTIEGRWRIAREDGSEVHAIGSALPLHGPDSSLIGALLTVRDETQRLKTEYDLHKNRTRLEQALEAARMITWDWTEDENVVHYNPEALGVMATNDRTLEAGGALLHPADQVRVIAAVRQALAEGSDFRQEFRVMTPGGPRWVSSAARVMTDEQGRRYMSGVLADINEQREAIAQFEVLANNIGPLTWMADTNGRFTWISQRWTEVTGATIDYLNHPDSAALHDSAGYDDLMRHYEACIRNGVPWEDVFWMKCVDGRARWFLGQAMPIREDDGSIRHWFGSCTDITAQRAAEEHQRLLANELNHRVKNMLAVVQSLAMQSRRSADTIDGFIESFSGRLQALSAAHGILTEEAWKGALLADVLRGVLAAFIPDIDDPRLLLGGPDIWLAPSVATNLSMAIHELATNAVKYGALSTLDGRILVHWDVVDGALALEWNESGGPPVALPSRRGFGSRLIEQGITRELGGRACIDYLQGGLVARVQLPLSDRVRPAL